MPGRTSKAVAGRSMVATDSYSTGRDAGTDKEGYVNIDAQCLKQWIGRQEQRRDRLSAAPLNALAALGREDGAYVMGREVPALGCWLYSLPTARQAVISSDEHTRRSGFQSALSLPKRSTLPVEAEVERPSTILDLSHESGCSGELAFVRVRHNLAQADDRQMQEDKDIHRNPFRPAGLAFQRSWPDMYISESQRRNLSWVLLWLLVLCMSFMERW